MSIGSFFSSLGHSIAAFFGSHQATIQAVITEAQTAAGAATAVATALGEPTSVTAVIGKISSGLAMAGSTVTAESTAETLTQHASNLANLATDLVTSGAIGVKNTETIQAIGSTATKVQAVVGALETAATVAPKAPGA